MNSQDGEQGDASRRSFLRSSGGLFTSLWISAQWPSIAAAAHHAEQANTVATPRLEFFDSTDADDVEAIAAQIIPSGATPGAREAHAVYFIDASLSTYFSALAPSYREGLRDFQGKFHTMYPATTAFGKADASDQFKFLKTVDNTPFFEATRLLTVLGMFASPKYGGNFQGAGWKLMGFVDQHAFTPPFGYYDARYTGFVPYPEKT